VASLDSTVGLPWKSVRWWQHAVPSQEHCHPSVLWCCWLGDRKGIWIVKISCFKTPCMTIMRKTGCHRFSWKMAFKWSVYTCECTLSFFSCRLKTARQSATGQMWPTGQCLCTNGLPYLSIRHKQQINISRDMKCTCWARTIIQIKLSISVHWTTNRNDCKRDFSKTSLECLQLTH